MEGHTFRAIADLLPEPMLLVRRSGAVVAANAAFTSAFGWRRDEIEGRALGEHVVQSAAEVEEYLRRCGATSRFLPGAVVICRKDSIEVPCRAEGAAFRASRLQGGEPLVILRLTPKTAATAQFVTLTRKIGDLSAEVERRRRAEQAAADALERECRVRERLSALSEASEALVSSPLLRDVLPAIGSLAERLIPADAYAVWHRDATTGEWRVAWRQHLSDRFVAATRNWTSPGSSGAPPAEPLFVENLDEAPLLASRRPEYVAEGIHSLVVIPLRVGSSIYGTVVTYYRRPISIGIDDRRVASALGNFASSALAMATLYEAESGSRIAAQVAEHRAAFLAKASATLASSLDYEATLKTVATLAVPEIADWCAVHIGGPGGKLKRLAIAHTDPSKIEIARTLQERYPEAPESPYGAMHAMRTVRPLLMSRISDELLAANTRDAEHLRLIRSLGLTSYMCVPLAVRGRALGVLTFVSAESGREYTDSDLRFAEEVASRAALAVENARAYEEAQQANQLKDEFLATLSHELRTPLNAVLGYARLIRAGIFTADKQAKALDVLERNALALNQMVEDVLDVSRIVAGKIRLNVRPVDLSVVLHDAAASVLPAAEAKGVKLEVGLDPAAAPVWGDPDRLQQVAWNLLANAVKFTPRDGSVHLQLEQVGSSVEVTISDTGVGIRPDVLPHVFERFRQGDSGFGREYGGLGLGLAITRHIVEMHGGTIGAASDGEGCGARFTVRLPAMAMQRATAADAARLGIADAPQRDLSGTWPGQLAGIRVLAVDDDADSLMLLTEILAAAGARVHTAASARAALQQLESSGSADVLLTDIGMPGMDGLEMIAAIRRSARPEVRDIPAVALTAYARSDDRARALESGYQMHLAKPVNPSELIAALRTLARPSGAGEARL